MSRHHSCEASIPQSQSTVLLTRCHQCGRVTLSWWAHEVDAGDPRTVDDGMIGFGPFDDADDVFKVAVQILDQLVRSRAVPGF